MLSQHATLFAVAAIFIAVPALADSTYPRESRQLYRRGEGDDKKGHKLRRSKGKNDLRTNPESGAAVGGGDPSGGHQQGSSSHQQAGDTSYQKQAPVVMSFSDWKKEKMGTEKRDLDVEELFARLFERAFYDDLD